MPGIGAGRGAWACRVANVAPPTRASSRVRTDIRRGISANTTAGFLREGRLHREGRLPSGGTAVHRGTAAPRRRIRPSAKDPVHLDLRLHQSYIYDSNI